MRGSWRPNRTATYWPQLLWPSAFLSRSPGLLNWRPGGPAFCWVLAFSSTTCLQTLLIPRLTDYLSSPSYIIVQSSTQYIPITGHRNMHFRRLWNGMFDRHRAEITVMQFKGHSLPVHQFVTVPWEFKPVPYCQPSSPTPMEYTLPPSLEWHVWRGRRSIYNTVMVRVWPSRLLFVSSLLTMCFISLISRAYLINFWVKIVNQYYKF